MNNAKISKICDMHAIVKIENIDPNSAKAILFNTI